MSCFAPACVHDGNGMLALLNFNQMKSLTLYLIAIICFAFASCSDHDPEINPTQGLVKISEGYALGAGAKVELWAKQELFTGYNQLFVALYDSVTKSRITEAHVHLNPAMSMMGGMTHACPTENPEDQYAVNKLFPGAAVFIMPTSDMGSWMMNISVHNHNNEKFGTAALDITVVDPEFPMMKSFQSESGEKFFISYLFPAEPKVGVNDFTMVVNKMESMMSFPAVDNFEFELTPEMPSMGHGSPNNVNPMYTQAGHYKGKVNFTMTGEWRLNLELIRNEALLKEMYFDLVVE